ncbi:hypothetical protein MUB24_22900 [Lederbergia sp. NSJ-179]|uniref:hypothetical protein n=1 Tax=Lederbergia sp. NSJ-179 TaxID=2931402 RepID=UPI001FD5D12C|nr:hypothetical protein [Lederbergia sp. NSJ-179]MCJ7843661.1 hypothetical protein [Lederbergia sp. NSJ-179]
MEKETDGEDGKDSFVGAGKYGIGMTETVIETEIVIEIETVIETVLCAFVEKNAVDVVTSR